PQSVQGQVMVLNPKTDRRIRTPVWAWASLIVTLSSLIGMGQFVTAQDTSCAQRRDEAIDEITQKAAAVRLLAAMGSNTSVDTKVARLTGRLVARDQSEVQAAVTALVTVGASAVPAIIRRMDDRRDMPVRAIAFENRAPDAFEAVRWPAFAKVI